MLRLILFSSWTEEEEDDSLRSPKTRSWSKMSVLCQCQKCLQSNKVYKNKLNKNKRLVRQSCLTSYLQLLKLRQKIKTEINKSDNLTYLQC